MYCLKVAVNITAFAIARRSAILKVTRSSCDAVLQAHPGTNGPASAEPPARTHRAGGTALANVEPEELSYLLASPSPQDSSLQVLLCRRHAEPDTNVTVCSDRAGDHGAAFYHSIAVPGPKLASRGRTFPVHPAASRCRMRAVLSFIHWLVGGAKSSRCSPGPLCNILPPPCHHNARGPCASCGVR